MHTMRFHDELVPADDLDIPSPTRKPKERELEMASKLLESLQAKFDPTKFEDGYRERLLDYIKAKAKGKTPERPKHSDATDPDDLMAALEASLPGKG